MRTKLWMGALVVTVLAAAGGTPLSAQEVVTQPGVIRSCLCEELSVEALATDTQQSRRIYDQRRSALQSLQNQVQTRRAQINVYDRAEIDSFKQLLAQRDQAASDFAGSVTPNYDAVAERYNAAVADYNNRCAGRDYDPGALAAARQNLFCPRPEAR